MTPNSPAGHAAGTGSARESGGTSMSRQQRIMRTFLKLADTLVEDFWPADP